MLNLRNEARYPERMLPDLNSGEPSKAPQMVDHSPGEKQEPAHYRGESRERSGLPYRSILSPEIRKSPHRDGSTIYGEITKAGRPTSTRGGRRELGNAGGRRCDPELTDNSPAAPALSDGGAMHRDVTFDVSFGWEIKCWAGDVLLTTIVNDGADRGKYGRHPAGGRTLSRSGAASSAWEGNEPFHSGIRDGGAWRSTGMPGTCAASQRNAAGQSEGHHVLEALGRRALPWHDPKTQRATAQWYEKGGNPAMPKRRRRNISREVTLVCGWVSHDLRSPTIVRRRTPRERSG